ncbi:MAG: methyltransferase domain-containing protein [Gammaproteobacteria bacterium]|nr:methyltransferase domain-containing protein [Gammaproteobacteria bacterium]MDH5800425.1 methyltransferase domain-containing protein [Gammaproteobacteria bacterium]
MTSRASLMGTAFVLLADLVQPLRMPLWRWWYNRLAKKYTSEDLLFMNYGYADPVATGSPLKLKEQDEPYRYPIQLYEYVTNRVDLQNKDVLEVGCGRGGGMKHLAGAYPLHKITGVDLSKIAVAWCRQHHRLPNAEFLQGRAEDLPLNDHSVDLVINVESSHCYADMSKFVNEVFRVLRPDGIFTFCDLRTPGGVDEVKSLFQKAGFDIIYEEQINQQVVRALDLVYEQRKRELQYAVPKIWRKVMRDFAALKGSSVYNKFRQGELQYVHYLMQKR